MTGHMRQVLDDIVERLVKTAHPLRIVLFGSHARTEAAPDSDLDLLVIESEPFGGHRSRFKEIARLERALGKIPVPTDILVYRQDEIEGLVHSTSHIVAARALRQGNVLCARP